MEGSIEAYHFGRWVQGLYTFENRSTIVRYEDLALGS